MQNYLRILLSKWVIKGGGIMDHTHMCISIAGIHKVLHASKQKLKLLQSLIMKKKRALKRSRNWGEKFSLGLDCTHSWGRANHCYLRGFDGFVRNVQQLFTLSSLHQCLQRTVKNEPKQLSISNQHIRVPRWRAFNFALRCVLGMSSNSGIKV